MQKHEKIIEKKKNQFSKNVRGAFYIFLILVGFLNMVFSLKALVES